MTAHQKWLTQLNKGFLELSILALLNKHCDQENYGSHIKKTLESAGININEGTLYPLLNRMHDNDYLTSSWQTPDKNKGHPIRLYAINAQGKELLQTLLASLSAKPQARYKTFLPQTTHSRNKS